MVTEILRVLRPSSNRMVFPADDEREYVGGTLIVEESTTSRTFVTTGRALLKFTTPTQTFAASWDAEVASVSG